MDAAIEVLKQLAILSWLCTVILIAFAIMFAVVLGIIGYILERKEKKSQSNERTVQL